MMNKKSLLSFFLLTLFLYPQMDKWAHVHHIESEVSKTSSEETFHKAQAKCAICHFEFSLFHIIKQNFHFCGDLQIPYQYILSYSAIVLDVVKHQAERGPPVF
ncbi:MAG: hypothetical protein ACK5UE_13535 [Chitinophagales bacterium]|jgi:hypothetical protein|nr:hypothetical protein [Sphingobacteriales bacterium]